MEGWMLYIFISCLTFQADTAEIRFLTNQLDNGEIVRHAMGQNGIVGYLWNDVTGRMLYEDIFNTKIPDSYITTTKMFTSELEFGSLHMANVSEWFEYQEIPDEQQLIVFAQRFIMSGDMHHFDEYVGKDVYSLNAQFKFLEQKLDIFHPELRDKYNVQSFDSFSRSATHVITGVINGLTAELLMKNPNQRLTIEQDIELKALLKSAAEEMNKVGHVSEKTRNCLLNATENFNFEWKSSGYSPSGFAFFLPRMLRMFENIPNDLKGSSDLERFPLFYVLTPLEEFFQFLPSEVPRPTNQPTHQPMTDAVKAKLLNFTQEFREKREKIVSLCDLLNYNREVFYYEMRSSYTSLCWQFSMSEIQEKYLQVLTEIRYPSENGQDDLEEFLEFVRNSSYSEDKTANFFEYVSKPVKLIRAVKALEAADVKVEDKYEYDRSVYEYVRRSPKSFVLYFDSRSVQNETYMDLFMENQKILLALASKKHDNATFVMSDCAKNKCEPICTDKVNPVCIIEYRYAKIHNTVQYGYSGCSRAEIFRPVYLLAVIAIVKCIGSHVAWAEILRPL